jgi:hypothetical protein
VSRDVFRMETKLRSNKMAIIKQKLGFKNMLVVDSIGRSGGLALLWKDEEGVEVPDYSQRHINATVKPTNLNKLTFTGFYGHPKTHRRNKACGLLKYLKSMEPGPWLCADNFNEILSSFKKVGGRRRTRYLMENF